MTTIPTNDNAPAAREAAGAVGGVTRPIDAESVPRDGSVNTASIDVAEAAILTAAEAEQLAKDEAIIEAGITVFYKVGMALCRIRDQHTYRATHATFEDYVNERWSMSRTRAYQLIESGVVADQMSTIVDIPQIENEGQARAIAPIVKEHGPDVAADVLRVAQQATEGKVTAKAIKAAAKETVAPKPVKPKVTVIREPEPKPVKPKVTVIREPEPKPVKPKVTVIREPEPKPVKPKVTVIREPEPKPVKPKVTVIREPEPDDATIRAQTKVAQSLIENSDPVAVALILADSLDHRVANTTDPLLSAGVLLAAWSIVQFCGDDPDGALEMVRQKVAASLGGDA
ncbi:MAG: hypothetical protein V9E98_02040 [Candidatus Nanopelagicales bacterium]